MTTRRRTHLLTLVLLAALVLLACQSTPRDETTTTGGEPADEPSAVAAAAANTAPQPPTAAAAAEAPASAAAGQAVEPATRPADPGPRFEQHTGTPELERRDLLELPALAHHRSGDGHLYLLADLALPPDAPPVALHLVGHPGAAVAAEGQLALRLPDGTLPEAPVELVLYAGGIVQPLRITGGSQSPARDTLEARFFALASAWYQDRGGRDWSRRDPFLTFAAHRLARRAGAAGDPSALAAVDTGRARRSELYEMMSLYTGVTSIEEALQTDRGLGVRAETATERKRPIAELDPVGLPAHPWAQMIDELGTAPVVEPLARFVPDDVIYLHFHDLRDFAKTAAELDQWLTPVSQALEARPGDSHFVDRYESQLAVRRSGLSETLGHLAADSVALVIGDPYLREGTDVSLVFDAASREILDTALATYEAEARQQHPDLATRSYELEGGLTVTVLETPDRSVYRHRLELDGGNVVILSNSPGAIARFAAVSRGQHGALADAGDFRYMRARYPFDPTAEDGFVFLGDALVGKVIGATHKIQQARRMDARADLAAVQYAALLHGQMEGALPADTAALRDAGWLAPEELAHADGAAIAFDLEHGARSERWGRAVAMTPLIDLPPVAQVSEAEAAAYQAFARSYQEYWRAFVDPIGARIVRSDDGRSLTLDARMLPLIENTEYDELIEAVGDARLSALAAPAGGLRWGIAIGEQAEVRRELDELMTWASGRRESTFGWLGGWALVGVDDHSALWDAALIGNEVPQLERTPGGSNAELEILSRLPAWLAVDVDNSLVLAGVLTGLRGMVETSAPGMVEWADGGKYREIPIVTVRQPATLDDDDRIPVEIHYAIAGRVLLMSLRVETLRARIDDALDGHLPKSTPASDEFVQTRLEVVPAAADGWMSRTLLGLLEKQLISGHDAAERAEAELRRAAGAALDDPQTHRQLALALLGFEPHSPGGGEFSAQDGLVTHSLYGSEIARSVPKLPIADSSLTTVLEGTERLDMQLGFEGEGNHRGLRVRVEWTRR